MYKTIIIEDELHAQTLLANICKAYCPTIDIVGIADNVQEGITLIEKTNPDLAFLDIRLSDSLSFEILDKLSNRECAIIFTTAYEHYALKAFKYEAVDYVMKPYSHLDIINAVNKVRKSVLPPEILKQISKILNKRSSEKLKVQTKGGFILIKSNDVIRIEADGAYATIYTTDGKSYITSTTLKDYEEKLSNDRFYRVHASHLINLESISQIKTEDGCTAILKNGHLVPVSRRNKQDFLNILMND
jgi:two-component system LytT family response regulator